MRATTSKISAIAATAAAIAVALTGHAAAQGQTGLRNLTPDGYWHNRYHALLSMAAYGDYQTLCPNQTFTEASKLKNFPNSTRPPWDFRGSFGPTPSGAKGFMVIVPEMNKALIVFEGNRELEQTLPTDVVSWGNITRSLGYSCPKCTANAFAVQGYLEAKNETNNFEAIREPYYNSGLVFSIAGHGLGGMHALLASVDFNDQEICYYSHNYGTPRTFNEAGAKWYNSRFNGEAGERGVANNDLYTEFIPASDDYTHAGTIFYYSGHNRTGGMNWNICWDNYDDPECAPRSGMSGTNSTSDEDHYFYFSNVGQCGGQDYQNVAEIESFLESPSANSTDFIPFSYSVTDYNYPQYTTTTRRRSSTTSSYRARTTSSYSSYSSYSQPSTTSSSSSSYTPRSSSSSYSRTTSSRYSS